MIRTSPLFSGAMFLMAADGVAGNVRRTSATVEQIRGQLLKSASGRGSAARRRVAYSLLAWDRARAAAGIGVESEVGGDVPFARADACRIDGQANVGQAWSPLDDLPPFATCDD